MDTWNWLMDVFFWWYGRWKLDAGKTDMVDGEMVGEQLLNQRTKVTHYEYIPKVLRKGDRFHGPVAQLSLMFNHICRCIRMYIVLVDVEYSIHKRKTKLLMKSHYCAGSSATSPLSLQVQNNTFEIWNDLEHCGAKRPWRTSDDQCIPARALFYQTNLQPCILFSFKRDETDETELLRETW